jgi:hypothetical protein
MKATHDGNCQICGRLQRLPGGLLAAHGYTVEWGFFSGTCPGSHATPFQVSTHLIEAAIACQETAIDSLKADAAALRNPANPDNVAGRAWHRSYDGNSKRGYFWEKGTVRGGGFSTPDYQNHYSCPRFFPDAPVKGVFDADPVTGAVKIETYGAASTIEEVTQWLNVKYAGTLENRIGEIRKWIAWQRNRLVGWKPEPLIPRAK